MAITQTTIGPANSSVYNKYKGQDNIPAFLRLMVANTVAMGTESWIQNYKYKSSHTNSAQYIIVDYRLVGNSINKEKLSTQSVVIFENLGDS